MKNIDNLPRIALSDDDDESENPESGGDDNDQKGEVADDENNTNNAVAALLAIGGSNNDNDETASADGSDGGNGGVNNLFEAFMNNEQSAIENIAKQLQSLLLKGKDAKYDQLLADYKHLLEKGASDLEPIYLAVEKLSEQLKALGSIQNKGLSTLLGVDPKKAEEGKETLTAERARQVGLVRLKQTEIDQAMLQKGEGYDEMLKSELGKHLSVGFITLSTPDVHPGKRKYNEFMKGTKLKFAPVSTEADEAS